MRFRYLKYLGESVVEIPMTAEEARFIADLLPFEDAASKEWDYIARTLEKHNKAREEEYE